MDFVSRRGELSALEAWDRRPTARAAIVWGRRRVGKTALVQHFAADRRTVFHTGAGRSMLGELALLSRQAARTSSSGTRDLASRPFVDWDDALDGLAAQATREPLLVVLDEFPELVSTSPELPGVIRAFMDRMGDRSKLRLLLCGSAVRTMAALQEERAPLYGRFDVALHLQPFTPAEAALLLPRLSAADRALVYGLVGGMPLYLSWWDQRASIKQNLRSLACQPGAPLLTEGELVLATEVEAGEYPAAVLHSIAAGKTRHHEIKDQLRTEPARTLDRLIELRLVERLQPVTEKPTSRRRIYRITDNFLSFYLAVLSRYRAEIDRGLGDSILPVLIESLNDQLGPAYEQAFRDHLRAEAAAGRLEPNIVAVGTWWRDKPSAEIDAVILAGRSRRVVMVGEAKWAVNVDARRTLADLQAKAAWLVDDPSKLRYAIAARARVTSAPGDLLTVTAADIFPG